MRFDSAKEIQRIRAAYLCKFFCTPFDRTINTEWTERHKCGLVAPFKVEKLGANIKMASKQTAKQPAGPLASELIPNKFINKNSSWSSLITKWWRLQPIMCIVWIIDKLSSSTSQVPDDASQAGAAVTGDAMLHWLSVVSPQIEWIPTSCLTHSSLPLNRESFWVLDKLCAMSQAVLTCGCCSLCC